MLMEITLVETTLVLVGDSLYFMYEGVDDAQWTAFLEIVSWNRISGIQISRDSQYFMNEGVDDAQWAEFPDIGI